MKLLECDCLLISYTYLLFLMATQWVSLSLHWNISTITFKKWCKKLIVQMEFAFTTKSNFCIPEKHLKFNFRITHYFFQQFWHLENLVENVFVRMNSL